MSDKSRGEEESQGEVGQERTSASACLRSGGGGEQREREREEREEKRDISSRRFQDTKSDISPGLQSLEDPCT